MTRVWLWLLKSDEIRNSFMIKGKLKCLVCFADFDCVDHSKLCKILKEMEIPDHLTCLLRNICAGQEATELDIEQTGSKLGKEYIKAVYCHPVNLTYMQSTSWEMPG